ncbi:MAG: pilus assembly protein PilM [Candidatus Omnitrophica bacterium]|nr:pilus assembly protein PilM [Candidatus Omnitrophota bacterium]
MIKRILGAGNKNAIFALAISENVFKIIKCNISGNFKKEFVNIEFEPLVDGIDNQKLSEKVSQVLKKLGYNNNPIIVCLPRNQVTCRHLSIPAQAPQEVAKIASLQAPRYLPYPINELITGYQVVSTQKNGYSGVNLVIVHQDIISRYLEIFKGLNIKNFSIALGSYGLCNLYNYLNPQENTPVMIIDIDLNQVELVVISGKKMVFSRYFKLNRTKEDWRYVFIEEVNRSREAYTKEFLQEFSQKIIVLGNNKVTEECCKLLKEKFPLPVEAVDFYKKVVFLDTLVQKILSSGYSFASLVGFGLEGIEETLNLLPVESKEKGKQAAVYKKSLKTFIFIILILTIWVIAIVKNLDNKSKYLDRLKSELGKVTKEARPLEEIEKRSRILEDQNTKRVAILDLLTGCFGSLPNALYLTSFSYEEDNQVIVRGLAQELNSVFTFVSALEKLPEFKKFNIKVKYASKRRTKEAETVDFEIACVNINK